MRYQLEVDIDLPRKQVIDMFLNTENLAKWQPSLVAFEPIDGHETHEIGAKTRQLHKMGRREVEMIQTITKYNYPDEFSATYEADGVWNLIENRFIEIGEQKTQWVVVSEFKCSGLIRLMAVFTPGMFKRQTLTHMKQFKEFAENARR